MLVMIVALIATQKDFGAMLYAERKVRVYQRIDGGDGRISKGTDEKGIEDENGPRKDIPYRTWNMLVPVFLLIFFIFFLMIRTGDDGTGDQSFAEKIEASDSFSALLWGTMATAIFTTLLYTLQIVQDGHYVMPSLPVIRSCLFGNKGMEEVAEEGAESEGEEQALVAESSQPRSLVSFYECIESFLFGMGRLFPALIVLTLAWATGKGGFFIFVGLPSFS